MPVKLKPTTGRETLRKLQRVGFKIVRGRGSAHVLKNFETNREAYVHVHGNKDIPPGTLRNIIKQAGLTIKEFNEL